MASTIYVDKLDPQSGTALEIGSSGDTITIPSGATFTNSGTATGFGGITAASIWRVTADFTGDASPIASNWEAADSYGASNLGSAMSESSGIFTFPATGYWYIVYQMSFYANSGTSGAYAEIYTTTNNSAYTAISQNGAFSDVGKQQVSTSQFLFDVTDTANCKIRFDVLHDNTSNKTRGSTDQNLTCVSFIRLGDT